MMDYSIEIAAERIVDLRSKRYFSEVHGCYSAGYYRSAVVMLWSVVVTDLMFKLDQLATAYNDSTAQSILTEIGQLRINNPRSPEWEIELVNKVTSRTDLLDHAEQSFLHSLQSHRHLSAHPVMTSADALFAPNKETARAHIRNALDGVLTKPPIMSRRVFDSFIVDVEQLALLAMDAEGLSKFLETKYFRHFTLATHIQIFKSLWRLSFKSNDPRAETNRRINAQALDVVFSFRRAEITDAIRAERDWFSDVSFSGSHFREITRFFRSSPLVYSLLSEVAKVPIQTYAITSLDHFAVCWFVSDTPEIHLEEIARRIGEGQTLRGEIFAEMCESLSTSDCFFEALNIGIIFYFKSDYFDTADSRFEAMVGPFLDKYRRENCVKFLELCETVGVGQALGRRKASRDHRKVKEIIDSKFPDISIDAYPEFKETVE